MSQREPLARVMPVLKTWGSSPTLISLSELRVVALLPQSLIISRALSGEIIISLLCMEACTFERKVLDALYILYDR